MGEALIVRKGSRELITYNVYSANVSLYNPDSSSKSDTIVISNLNITGDIVSFCINLVTGIDNEYRFVTCILEDGELQVRGIGQSSMFSAGPSRRSYSATYEVLNGNLYLKLSSCLFYNKTVPVEARGGCITCMK